MKFKKFLVIVITILLCFTMFQKPKLVKADFVITPTILWALGTLVLGTGVVALNKEQVLHMGEMVWDRVGELGFQRDVVDYDVNTLVAKGVIWSDKLSGVLSWVSSNLPINDYSVKTSSVDVLPKSYLFALPNGTLKKFSELVGTTLTATFDTSLIRSDSDVLGVNGSYRSFVYNLPKMCVSSLTSHNTMSVSVTKSSDGFYSLTSVCEHGTKNFHSDSANTLINFVFYGDYLNAGNNSTYSSVPYSNPLVRENYFPDVLPSNETWDKEKSWGYVPVPSTIPDNAGSISADMPLTWDNVKDEVSDIPRTDVVDTPIEGDVPGTDIPDGLSLWAWLKALLMAILNMIKGIFDIIKNVFSTFFDFFTQIFERLYELFGEVIGYFSNIWTFLGTLISSLVTAFTDMLSSIFTVEEGYFIDKFNGFKTQFIGKLGVASYLDFLNYDFGSNSVKDITFNWNGQNLVIVKLSLYEKFRGLVNTLVYAFMFFLLAIYNYNQVYKLIRGSDYASASHYSMLNSMSNNAKRLE